MSNKMKSTPKEIDVRLIHANEWNVHRPCESGPEFQGLVDSIAKNGMMHRVVVRPLTDTEYEIVDGHRRFDAALALGWRDVPCEVLGDTSDEDAQAMTITANVQRIENDPILEAACIERLSDAGKTYEQIAAVLGKDARYVARRARLCNLTEKWRGWFVEKAPDAADTMEMVAAHERPLQDEVFGELDIGSDEGEVDDEQIERCFRKHLRKIDGETPFDISECLKCPFNTATHGWLFPAEEDDDCRGRCEKAECYVRKWNATTDAKIEELRKKKVAVNEVKQKWDIPRYWDAYSSKTRKNSVPWVYTEDGLKCLVWSEPKAASNNAGPAMTEEEKAAAKHEKAIAKARRSAYGKVRAIAKDNAETVVEALIDNVCWLKKRKEEILGQLTGGYAYDSTVAEIIDFVTAKKLSELGLELTEIEAEAVLTDESEGM